MKNGENWQCFPTVCLDSWMILHVLSVGGITILHLQGLSWLVLRRAGVYNQILRLFQNMFRYFWSVFQNFETVLLFALTLRYLYVSEILIA